MKTLISNVVFQAAQALHALGFLITLCQGKRPIGKGWHNRRYTAEQIEFEFDRDPALNLGIVLGKTSGIIDIECDSPQAVLDLDELFDGHIPRTPSWRSTRGGHWLFAHNQRLEEIGKAVIKYGDVEVRLGADGKAAHSLVPPSTTDGFTREWDVSLEDCDPVELPESVVDKLLAAVAKRPHEASKERPSDDEFTQEFREHVRSGLPGNDFNQRGEWANILVPKGWTPVSTIKGVTNWRRPGKEEGTSATTGYCETEEGKELFFCFSTDAAPIEPDKSYDKFGLYTALYHNGDFDEAAAELQRQGYGSSATSTGSNADGPTKAAKLLALTSDVELFHSPEGQAFAHFPVADHWETWSLDSSEFRRWLDRQFYSQYKNVAGATVLNDVIGLLSAQAHYEGPTRKVYNRVGEDHGDIYIDLGNDDWQVIEVTKDGWQVIDKSPVMFRRASGIQPLPIPQPGGDIALLREFVNVAESDFPLIVACLIAALRPAGPYPIAIFTGEHGSAKSTTVMNVRSLVDPNVSPLRATPRDGRDLMVAADNTWVLAYDNISKIPDWLSDALCRVATGGGFSTRKLYTNNEEIVFEVQRPTMLNGIGSPVTKEDLLDRAICFQVPIIPSTVRRPRTELLHDFEEKRPYILGALLDGVSSALAHVDQTKFDELPRMADFVQWVTAAEPGLGWQSGTILAAYDANRLTTTTEVLEDPVAVAIRALMDDRFLWAGRASDLLKEVEALVDTAVRQGQDWPKDASSFSNRLTRLAPPLREQGIDIERTRSGKVRTITLRNLNLDADESAQR